MRTKILKAMRPNTVMGIPEVQFRQLWVMKLWQAMAMTGKGYRRLSSRHSGGGKDRRADKLKWNKLERRLLQQQVANAR